MTARNNENNCLQYHQVDNFIHVLIKEADVSSSDLEVSIQKRRLTVVLTKGKNKTTLFEGLLFEGVDVGNCRTKINDDHILIKLRKENPTIDWPQLQLGGSAITSETPAKMTSLQRAQYSSPPISHAFSPEDSPTRSSLTWNPKNKVKEGVDSFHTSFSTLVSGVNKVLHELGEEKRDMGEEKRDEFELHEQEHEPEPVKVQELSC
jgi:hypothetical protein